MSYAIEGSGLRKTFFKKRSLRDLALHPRRPAERIPALRGVDLRVPRGEIFTLLGPNGAGKTTLLKIFSCLVLPDEGRALVGGFETRHEGKVKAQIGLVHCDERSFYWRLSARENLRFFARLYDVPGRDIARRVDELLERVDSSAHADRPFADYSSGMKQRIAIARALLHDPPILLMDEPTRSLDPSASLALRRFVRDELVARSGKTILLATHNLQEAEALSDRLGILVRGRVRFVGSVEEVRRFGIADTRFAVETDPSPAPLAGPFRVVSDELGRESRRIVVAPAAGARLHDVLLAIVAAGLTLRSCDRLEPDLEEAFSRIVATEEPVT